ncbi:MAG: sodium:proton antiporter [Rickettsiales bacterium]|nr:sodium:proton antiporter [Rickettsiales bacterium]MCA0254075.1 sodium:proton antiporter [Pseudomonadota bacterium]
MSYFVHFIPILLFVVLFVGCGIYFTILGIPNAFYQISPISAILPAIALAWLLHRGNTKEKMHDLLDGIRHRDIITMCIIFLLAGAFSEVTKEIGAIESTVNFALKYIPSHFLLIGLFLVSAFVSTSIGTSMGTIATIAPIGFAISQQLNSPPDLYLATVVGGAMFGDNISIISDTTIASVLSQEADMRKKLILNAKVAGIAAVITIIILGLSASNDSDIVFRGYNFILITPYLLLLLLALFGINVFVSISISITFAGIVGLFTQETYSLIKFSQGINKGFSSMNEIMILSLLVGGLSGLSGKDFITNLANSISNWIKDRNASSKVVQLVIAKLVSVFDILLANNTIAIIFTGEIARELSKRHKIPPHYTAAWLDIFSCVFQGIIPYGAQILLASAIAHISPLAIVPYVFYCYILGMVSIMYILLSKNTLDR